jgi:hypothetical protein
MSKTSQTVTVTVEYIEMDKIKLTNIKGDTYTSKREDLIDFLIRGESLSAAPTQQTNVLEYYQNARTEFCSKIDNLDVQTRTACDSFLLAFDHLLQSLKPQP